MILAYNFLAAIWFAISKHGDHNFSIPPFWTFTSSNWLGLGLAFHPLRLTGRQKRIRDQVKCQAFFNGWFSRLVARDSPWQTRSKACVSGVAKLSRRHHVIQNLRSLNLNLKWSLILNKFKISSEKEMGSAVSITFVLVPRIKYKDDGKVARILPGTPAMRIGGLPPPLPSSTGRQELPFITNYFSSSSYPSPLHCEGAFSDVVDRLVLEIFSKDKPPRPPHYHDIGMKAKYYKFSFWKRIRRP